MAVQINRNFLAVKARRKARKHSSRASEYARVAAWLTWDYFRHVRWKLVRVIVNGAIHIGLKFAAMGVLYLGVRALSEDLPVAVPGMDIIDPKSRTFLLLTVCVGVALLIGTALFRYEVRRRAIRLGRKYHEFCARRLLLLASHLPDSRTPLANRIVRAGLQQYTGYARYCGMTARALTQLLPTFASFIAVSLSLLWIDFWLTTVLATLALAAALAQYPANHRAAAASHLFERTRSEVSRRYGVLFRRLGSDPTPLPDDSPILKTLFGPGDVRDNMESICARASTGEQAALVSRIGSSILLGGTMIFLGIGIIDGDRSWATVAVYVAALRFTLSDFVSVCKIASNMTKYHAQISRYREFVLAAAPSLEPSDDRQAIQWPLELGVPGLDDPSVELSLVPGDVLVLLLPAYARLRLQSLLDGLADRRRPDDGFEGPVLVNGGLLAPEADLRANFGLPAEISEAAIEQALSPFVPAGADLAFATRGWLDRPLDQAVRPPDWLLLALHVVATRLRGRPLVAIDFARFRAMPDSWQQACRTTLADQALMLIQTTARPTGIGRIGVRAAIVSDGQTLCGWLPISRRSSIKVLAEAYARLNPGATMISADPGDEDDEVE